MREAAPADLARVVAAVRDRAPLVHCLTATVSMGLVADGLLAAGARPMMTETVAEAPTMTECADALLVNLGTLSADGAQGIPATVASSTAVGHPWVLDPAAVGVGPLRTALAHDVLLRGPSVVRGNASEIRVLAGGGPGGRGADARDCVDPVSARDLALRSGAVVAVSGPVDLVTDGRREVVVRNGSPMLTRVTGTGCLLGALTAACVVASSPWLGALTATAWLGIAGEVAATPGCGPGAFRSALLDALDALAPDDVATRVVLG
ncbi:MAG: hydroxyethylthiazole kinase [Dermatophilaceae bacterium]